MLSASSYGHFIADKEFGPNVIYFVLIMLDGSLKGNLGWSDFGSTILQIVWHLWGLLFEDMFRDFWGESRFFVEHGLKKNSPQGWS